MKIFYVIFLLLFYNLSYAQPLEFGGLDVEMAKNQEILSIKNRCISIDAFAITKNGEPSSVVNIDCPENYEYSITISNNCLISSSSNSCTYVVRIRLNDGGAILHQTSLAGGIVINFSGTFDEIPGFGNLGYPGTHNFVVEVVSTCTLYYPPAPPQTTTTTIQMDLPFQLVSTIGNSVYVVSEWDYTSIELGEIYCATEGDVICCNPNAFFLLRDDIVFSHEFIETSTSQLTWNSKISLGGSLGVFGVNNEVVASASISASTKELLKNSSTWRLDQKIYGKEGLCIFPGFQIIKQGILEKMYEANCNGPDVLISTNLIFVPTMVNVTDECSVAPSNDCDPISPPIINKGNNFQEEVSLDKFVPETDCNSFIMLDFGNTNVQGYSIGWTGPNGFQSTEFDLENLELGIYSYTITNSCCDILEGEVDLCPNMIEGPWMPQPDMVTFCKTTYCSLDDPIFKISQLACSSSSSDICVTADNTNEYFDGSNCIIDHFYQGEFIGQTISPLQSYEISFSNQLCSRITYCDGTEVNNETQFPLYGPWSFDMISEKCQRSIICFNMTMDDKDIKDAEIVETYNSFSGQCNRTAYCDGIPNTLPPVFPSNPGIWTYTSNGGCTKTINCSITSPPINVTGTPGYSNWSWNEFSNQCIANSVSCDNYIVGGATYNVTPSNYGAWDWTNDGPTGFNCYRDVFCGTTNSTVIDYGAASWLPTSITCPSNDNFVIAYLVCNGVQTTVSDCVLPFKDTDELDLRSLANSIVISPNPFSDYFTISGIENLENIVIEVLDSKGTLVFQAEDKQTQIDLSDYSEGIYLLRVLKESKLIINERIAKIN